MISYNLPENDKLAPTKDNDQLQPTWVNKLAPTIDNDQLHNLPENDQLAPTRDDEQLHNLPENDKLAQTRDNEQLQPTWEWPVWWRRVWVYVWEGSAPPSGNIRHHLKEHCHEIFILPTCVR